MLKQCTFFLLGFNIGFHRFTHRVLRLNIYSCVCDAGKKSDDFCCSCCFKEKQSPFKKNNFFLTSLTKVLFKPDLVGSLFESTNPDFTLQGEPGRELNRK